MGNNFCCAPEEDDDDIDQQYLIDNKELDKNGIGTRKKQADRIEVRKSGVGDFNKINLNHFELLKVIGKGSFGKVILYAMKILKKGNIDSKNKFKHTQNERKILENSNYHFAVSLRYAFQNDRNLYFIMDFINGGELFRRLRKNGPFSEETSKFYIAEIMCAINYLHKKNIIYRDLKPENVLLDSEGHLKLTDFGLAKQMQGDSESAFTICGTPEYLAPEIIRRQGYGKEVDYWTIGILLYELLTLRTPFRAKDKKQIFENVLNKKVQMKDDFSEEVISLLSQLLVLEPTKRLGSKGGIEAIQQHPFFKNLDCKKISERKETPPWKPDLQDMNDLKYFDERLLDQDPYAKDSQDSDQDSDDNMQFDGFTLDPSKLRTFALTPNKRSQISQMAAQSKKSQMQQQQFINQQEKLLLMKENVEEEPENVNNMQVSNINQSTSQNNSPKNSQVQETSKSAFHQPVSYKEENQVQKN